MLAKGERRVNMLGSKNPLNETKYILNLLDILSAIDSPKRKNSLERK